MCDLKMCHVTNSQCISHPRVSQGAGSSPQAPQPPPLLLLLSHWLLLLLLLLLLCPPWLVLLLHLPHPQAPESA
jgi:hypothetical protein